jgi:hypothetical protein
MTPFCTTGPMEKPTAPKAINRTTAAAGVRASTEKATRIAAIRTIPTTRNR